MDDHDDANARAERAKRGSPFLNTKQAAFYIGLHRTTLEAMRNTAAALASVVTAVSSATTSTTSTSGRYIMAAGTGTAPMRKPGPQPVPSLARERRGRARRRLAAFLDHAVRPAPRLVWNPSASAPVGLWRVHPGAAVGVGDMVLARTPEAVRRLAAERHYLPGNVPLLKRVAAVRGDHVCAVGETVAVNGRMVARRHAADAQGRPLPWWTGCRTLRDDEVLLLMDAADSFDGRYFGPVECSAIIGEATPLWTG